MLLKRCWRKKSVTSSNNKNITLMPLLYIQVEALNYIWFNLQSASKMRYFHLKLQDVPLSHIPIHLTISWILLAFIVWRHCPHCPSITSFIKLFIQWVTWWQRQSTYIRQVVFFIYIYNSCCSDYLYNISQRKLFYYV